MRITPLEDNNGRKTLSVEADWSELVPDYEDIVAGYSKVRLSGFRPGRVPRAVIEKRFRREIKDDLAHRCVQRLGRDAVREAGIEALGPVEGETIECEKDKPFRFQIRFQPMPEVALPDINSLKIDAGGADPRDQISRRLLDLVSFEVPDILVRDELALDSIDVGGPGSAEWKEASDRIRLMLILRRIAGQEGIEVEEADVSNRIAKKAKEFGISKEGLKEELAKGGGLERLRYMLLAESTLDYLIEKIRVSSEE